MEHFACLLCDSNSLKELVGYERAFLVSCESCGFIFSRKIPTSQELEFHYQNYRREYSISPLTQARYHDLLDKFEPLRKTNRLLDAGCGSGYFLEVALKRGWEVFGTEYTDDAVKICEGKNIRMQKGSNAQVSFPDDYFDVITSFEVLEHSNKPCKDIAAFEKWLRKGGVVYLTTPNFNALTRYILKSKYNVIEYPEHLCYFTPKTLEFLFHKLKFKRLVMKTTGVSFSRFKNSSRISVNASSGESDEKIRRAMEKGILGRVKSVANTLLKITGTGDSLKAMFEKG